MIAARLHVRHSGLRDVEHGIDVGAKDAIDLVGLHFDEAAVCHLVGGVVHQHVDAAELIHHAGHERPAVLRILDIAGDAEAAALRRLDHARRLSRVVFFFRQIRDRHIGAFPREGECHGAADAAVAAGNERFLALELAAAAVGRLAVVRLRLHLFFAARRLLPLFREGLRDFFFARVFGGACHATGHAITRP
jgi:hypothetical protein